jgi:hypothetical protein
VLLLPGSFTQPEALLTITSHRPNFICPLGNRNPAR